jgi:hypothetical protein
MYECSADNVSYPDDAVGDWETGPTDSRDVSEMLSLAVVTGTYSCYTNCSRFKRMVPAHVAHYQVDPVAYSFTQM